MLRILSNLIYGMASLFWWSFKSDTLKLKKLYGAYCLNYIRPINPVLVKALVAGEDHRHYKHRGVDTIALIRAMWYFLFKASLQGGSTIEQQLVRTLTARYERTLRRKVREILLASTVERIIPKKDIASVYLTIAYYGARMNGLQGALAHLGLSQFTLTYREAASVVARLKYPEPASLSSRRHAQIQERTEHILRLMNEEVVTPIISSTDISNGITSRTLTAS